MGNKMIKKTNFACECFGDIKHESIDYVENI